MDVEAYIIDKQVAISELAGRFDIATANHHVIFNAYDAPSEHVAHRIRGADSISMVCDAMCTNDTIQFYSAVACASLTKLQDGCFSFKLTSQ